MCQALNFALSVAGEAVSEFVRPLRAEMRDIKQYAGTQETLHRVIASETDDQYAFMCVFYGEVLSGTVRTPDQFEMQHCSPKWPRRFISLIP